MAERLVAIGVLLTLIAIVGGLAWFGLSSDR
jgi:hypothetical protein